MAKKSDAYCWVALGTEWGKRDQRAVPKQRPINIQAWSLFPIQPRSSWPMAEYPMNTSSSSMEKLGLRLLLTKTRQDIAVCLKIDKGYLVLLAKSQMLTAVPNTAAEWDRREPRCDMTISNLAHKALRICKKTCFAFRWTFE